MQVQLIQEHENNSSHGIIQFIVLTNIVVQMLLTVNTCISHDTESLFLFRKIILSTQK
jgi:hypothetical protein